MSTEPEHSRKKLEGVRIPADSWFAYALPTGPFPLSQTRRAELTNIMRDLVMEIRRSIPLQRAVWLLLDELHRDDAVKEISRNAELWNPEPGIGVRPEGPSPHYWTSSDLLDRDFTDEMPPMKQTVMGLETSEAGMELSCNLMGGRGGLIQVLHREPTAALVASWHAVIQPTIQEEGLAAYSLYVPIVSAATLKNCEGAQLDQWLGPVEVYLRESAEDHGILILSKHPLEASLRSAGITIPS